MIIGQAWCIERERRNQMTKKLFSFAVIIVIVLLLSVLPAMAHDSAQRNQVDRLLQATPTPIYVDLRRAAGNEDGSQANPYNTRREGEGLARSLVTGGYVLVINQNGTPEPVYLIKSAVLGVAGSPLPRLTLYILLAILALVLILASWFFRRRAVQLEAS